MKISGKFIAGSNEYSTLENYVPAPYLRRSFAVYKEVVSADIKITGLGFYRLFINGKDITKGLLAPYRSNPEDIVYFDEYDIKSLLSYGKNAIGIILGNGMQNALGAYIWDFDKANWRSAPKTCFQLEIKYADEDIQTIISDDDVKTAQSPILFDDLHYGEYYDARKETVDWNSAGFDDSGWNNAVLSQTPGGEFRLCEAEPITLRQTRAAVSVTKYDDGYIYDFGVNDAGLFSLKIRNTSAGQKVWFQCFEILQDGKPFTDKIRFNYGMIDKFQEDIYYCAGAKEETYSPSFTYHGFRYIYVTGITDEQATDDLLTYCVYNSALDIMGSFECDDEVVNKLQEATLRSDLSNFYYFPTDCPQREKNGWTADAALSVEQMLLNITPEKSYKEWMRNICKALNDSGQLPGIVPTTGWGYEWGNGPAWDCVITEIPYQTYIYRGDISIAREAAVAIMRYLTYLYSRLDENNLLAIGLGDWCQVGRKSGKFLTPLVVTDSILAADIANKAAFLFEKLGYSAQSNYAKELYTRLRDAVYEHLIDHNAVTVKGDTQTGQAMAIYYNMFSPQEKKRAAAHLAELIDAADGHFDVGVLGAKVIFRVLAENGYADLAYNMITRPDFPSYGNWIKHGATTLWESFFGENDTSSRNHHFWGDISAWFYTYLAGIRINPDRYNVNEVNIAPCFVEKLNFVKASYGQISVEWRRNEQGIDIKIQAPENITGKVVLPSGYEFEDGARTATMSFAVSNVLHARNRHI